MKFPAAIAPKLLGVAVALASAAAAPAAADARGVTTDTEHHHNRINKSGADVRTLLRRIPHDLTPDDIAFERSLRGVEINSDEDVHGVGQTRTLEICSKKNQKAEECGADKRDGRGKKCCSGLKCGGEKNKFCVTDKDADDDKDDKDKDKDEDDKDKDDDDKDEDDKKKFDSKDLSVYDAPPIDRSGDKSKGFLWHLYYEPGIKWAPRGYDFCVMCRNFKCKKGDYVVTSHCSANEEHHRWEWVEVEDGKGLMKTKSEDLCLDGNGDWDFVLRPCDKDNEEQHFENIDLTGEKFQLLPSGHQKSKPQCMTMLHHPLAANDDDGEMIIDQPCYKAEKTETSYWTADYRPKISEKLKKADKSCRNKDCDECEGYCEKDSECKGDLVCYERGNKGWRTNLESGFDPNPNAQIPGCSGQGRHGKNYCSKKKYVSPYSDKEIKKILDNA
mmetsp:Transcript_14128/g.30306  ORF Transcript_14128/g.30306 Transcript_14128/m.30306 type:complete len:444 (-) Transcript_14128:119-1450(-)